MVSGVELGVASMLFTNKNEGSNDNKIKMKKIKMILLQQIHSSSLIFFHPFIKLLW